MKWKWVLVQVVLSHKGGKTKPIQGISKKKHIDVKWLGIYAKEGT